MNNESLEKAAQTAELLRQDLLEVYRTLVSDNPLAAELFREHVLGPAVKVMVDLNSMHAISERVTS